MADCAVSERSRVLGDRVEALARALREAAADPETSARLLASAAAATLDALALELMLEAPEPPATAAEPVGEESALDDASVRLAA